MKLKGNQCDNIAAPFQSVVDIVFCSNFLKMLTVLSLLIDSIIFDLALVWANLGWHKISFHS